MNMLETIAARTRERVEEARRTTPDAQVAEAARAAARASERDFSFEGALAQDSMSFICEVKKASPSKGVIAEDFPYLDIARDYERAGAAAISCLTEPFWFQGSDAYLRDIVSTVDTPVLRKDFVVDARMVYEAKLLGASAVLLICAILDDKQLAAYIELADELGISALVEAHDAQEVRRACATGARVVGVNNRDLRTFEVDLENSLRLREEAGSDVVFVSESGIKTPEQVARLAQAGVDAVLVGESLMRASDRSAALAKLAGNLR